ncbi:DUF397 domain-containing protein [Saccharopolyspora hirsuta]|uniref:DUF397 domain-containing protein n=1 Tax=Saccharopolyspora hirsuta TaxID=1837 RepID=UPI003321AFC3
MNNLSWQKSSYSNLNGNCVELSNPRGLIRDSKNPEGPVLQVDIEVFLEAVKTGRFES